MQDHIEAIRAAVTDGATPEQKAHGAQACRAILAALGAQAGSPIIMAGAPTPHPLAGIDPGQAIDLLIAKLSAMLPKEGDAKAAAAPAPPAPPMRIAFVAPPVRAPGPRTAPRRRPR